MRSFKPVKGEHQRKTIPCPQCGCVISNVKDSRASASAIRRRRECEKCQQRFTTYELLDCDYHELGELRDFKTRMRDFLA